MHGWCAIQSANFDFAYFEICRSISLMQLRIINWWAASCSAKQEVHYHLILFCEDKHDAVRMFHAGWRQHHVQGAFSASVANMGIRAGCAYLAWPVRHQANQRSQREQHLLPTRRASEQCCDVGGQCLLTLSYLI